MLPLELNHCRHHAALPTVLITAGWNNCMLKRLRSERLVLLSWLFLCGLIVGTCSHAALWVLVGVHVRFDGGSEEWKRGGMFRSKMKRLPFRQKLPWQQWHRIGEEELFALFFYTLINLIHHSKIACVVFESNLSAWQTHRKMHALYAHTQMTQLVILPAWCAVTNKRLLYGAAV